MEVIPVSLGKHSRIHTGGLQHYMSQYVQEKERKKIKLENPVAHREFIFSIIPTADK